MIKNVSLANNEGTYSGVAAVTAVGTADPAFANSEIFIDDKGTINYRGAHPKKAPGHFRFSKWRFRLTNAQKESLDQLIGE